MLYTTSYSSHCRNTERISRTRYSNEHKKEKTNNYYLQFKHQYDRHTKDKTPHLQLRMVTDGTLLQEVITNPIMKEEYLLINHRWKG